ncbi:hypothetical protein [Prosthecobacter sp.]|uniref:hypothetical protein n=1 Tax=Prosthecobacter sp. TaxID=1965333 RepID=UPI0037840DD8
MHPADSAATFQSAVAATGKTVEELDARAALAQMAGFYRDERADNCILDEDGDTLVCQWGLYDEEGAEKSFQLEFVRHFIEPGNEDEDGMSQLSLTLEYAPTPELQALTQGTLQCSLPGDLAEFEKAVLASQPYRAVSGLKPQHTSLDWCML